MDQPDESLPLPLPPQTRSRMDLDEMLNDELLADSQQNGRFPPASSPTVNFPYQYPNPYMSYTGHVYDSIHTPTHHQIPQPSFRSQPTYASQTRRLPELPAFVPRTYAGYYTLPTSAPLSNHSSRYHHSTPPRRPDYTMSHGPPGTCHNIYLPAPNILPRLHEPVSGQFIPAQPVHENLHQPNLPGHVPQDSITLQPLCGPPQPGILPLLRTCSLCLERMEDKPSNFPFSCPECDNAQYCAPCLKDWFLDASKNESRMPPQCCAVIPSSAVKRALTVDQMNLYKAKFEEWMTPDKVYCPVPTCSAFIPPRLYQKPRKNTIPSAEDIAMDDGDQPKIHPDSPPTVEVKPVAEVKINAECPKCSVQVCTKCRSFTHEGLCADDLDPALAEQLKKWKIKRCPRCRTGVRKVYGCAHVECRCGTHFCWECLEAADKCRGMCDEDSRDESGFEEDDIDGLAGYYDGDGHEFGPEPENDFHTGWSCSHLLVAPYTSLPAEAECHRCFRNAIRVIDDAETVASKRAKYLSGKLGEKVEEAEDEGYAHTAWQCRHCAMIVCGDCKETLEADSEASSD